MNLHVALTIVASFLLRVRGATVHPLGLFVNVRRKIHSVRNCLKSVIPHRTNLCASHLWQSSFVHPVAVKVSSQIRIQMKILCTLSSDIRSSSRLIAVSSPAQSISQHLWVADRPVPPHDFRGAGLLLRPM